MARGPQPAAPLHVAGEARPSHLLGGATPRWPPHDQILEWQPGGWSPGHEDAGGGGLRQDQAAGPQGGLQGTLWSVCGWAEGWSGPKWPALSASLVATEEAQEDCSPGPPQQMSAGAQALRAVCTLWEPRPPVPLPTAAGRACKAPPLTCGPAQAPALHLLANEAAEQASQGGQLGKVQHVVHSDVQGLGRQGLQFCLIGILHTCSGVKGTGCTWLAPRPA